MNLYFSKSKLTCFRIKSYQSNSLELIHTPNSQNLVQFPFDEPLH